jgi:four helix bundle protein
MEAFEKLEVWKRGCRLSVNVYKLLDGCRDFGFKDQLFRSALSVPSNIAEGYERGSRKEYVRFLNIAKGSCAEMRTQLYIGIETGIIVRELAAPYVQEACELSKMLQGLINQLLPTVNE